MGGDGGGGREGCTGGEGEGVEVGGGVWGRGKVGVTGGVLGERV